MVCIVGNIEAINGLLAQRLQKCVVIDLEKAPLYTQ